MVIVESPIFTKKVLNTLSDDEYRKVQNILLIDPQIGAIIPGTKGLRKLRIPAAGRGKRGGGRLIYYWLASNQIIYLMYLYQKNEVGDLTKEQLKLLAHQVEEYIHAR